MTHEILGDISNGLITEQTVTVTIEFLLYNAWAETFVYVSIRFGFQPSGLIWKDVEVEPVSLELHAGVAGILLVILEILVFVMTTYYLLQNLWELLKAMMRGWQESTKKFPGKLAAMTREFIYFYLLDGFNAMDWVSCIATIVVMTMFFQYVNSPLNQ